MEYQSVTLLRSAEKRSKELTESFLPFIILSKCGGGGGNSYGSDGKTTTGSSTSNLSSGNHARAST